MCIIERQVVVEYRKERRFNHSWERTLQVVGSIRISIDYFLTTRELFLERAERLLQSISQTIKPSLVSTSVLEHRTSKNNLLHADKLQILHTPNTSSPSRKIYVSSSAFVFTLKMFFFSPFKPRRHLGQESTDTWGSNIVPVRFRTDASPRAPFDMQIRNAHQIANQSAIFFSPAAQTIGMPIPGEGCIRAQTCY